MHILLSSYPRAPGPKQVFIFKCVCFRRCRWSKCRPWKGRGIFCLTGSDCFDGTNLFQNFSFETSGQDPFAMSFNGCNNICQRRTINFDQFDDFVVIFPHNVALRREAWRLGCKVLLVIFPQSVAAPLVAISKSHLAFPS